MYGKEIKNMRISNGYTQTEVAKATGIPQNTISWIENDGGIENIQQCVLLANFYGVSVDELIGRETRQNGTAYEFSYQHNNTKLIHKED